MKFFPFEAKNQRGIVNLNLDLDLNLIKKKI